jgi:uncharacterized lipoprotein YajG
MHRLMLVIAFLAALSAPAQTTAPAPPTGSSWQDVQALPVGASIQVKARHSHANCNLKAVDSNTLTCTHGKDVKFQRTDILTIKIPAAAAPRWSVWSLALVQVRG